MRTAPLVSALLLVGALVSLPTSVGARNLEATASHARGSVDSAPSINGRAVAGHVLRVNPGRWRGAGIVYRYQWQRCDAAGHVCAAIAGAVSRSFALTSGDVGHSLRVVVTASNRNGSAQLTLAPTRAVAPRPAAKPAPASKTAPARPRVSGTIYFDGRAKNMTQLSSYETTPGNLGTLLQAQTPATWSCLCFLANDMTVVPDARYGKVYSTHVGPGSRNPWNSGLPAGYASALLSKGRPNDLGKWNWFADAYKVPPGWNQPNFATVTEFQYATLTSPPLAIDISTLNGTPTLAMYRNAGKVTNNGSGWYGGAVQEQATRIVKIPFGKWIDVIVGVKWATDNSGEIRVYYRVEGQSAFTLAISRSKTPTWQYGTTSYSTVNPDGTNASGKQVNVLDQTGLYTGYSNGRTSFPANAIFEAGLTRSSDYATAAATLP